MERKDKTTAPKLLTLPPAFPICTNRIFLNDRGGKDVAESVSCCSLGTCEKLICEERSLYWMHKKANIDTRATP